MITEDLDLIEELAGFSSNPLGWVMWAFDWGVGELANFMGPEPWQKDLLIEVGTGLLTTSEAIQLATGSGHGIGKSAFVAWLILWAISTHEDTKGVVTANTENQLKTKTWVEVATWYRRFIAKDLFEMKATAIFSRDPAHATTWRIDMVPWSEKNTEAFAGLHNQGKRILVIFDEASGIPDIIWETVEGALTDKDTEIIWATFGNLTKATGRFVECFPGGKFSHRWSSRTIDSRQVSFTNKKQLLQWAEDYGEDSDFFRVRVKGQAPRQSEESFFSLEMVRAATTREIQINPYEDVILGVDFGRRNDPSCIYARQGMDARSRMPRLYFNKNTIQMASLIVAAAGEWNAKHIFLDIGGAGGGVYDQLLRFNLNVTGVDFGAGADAPTPETQGIVLLNKRAEMYNQLRITLPRLAIVDEVPQNELSLASELLTIVQTIRDRDGAIGLVPKEVMRSQGIKSQNVCDALALTFAYPIAPALAAEEINYPGYVSRRDKNRLDDYNPFDGSY